MKRVHYFTGKLLSVEDFQTEQEYHLDKRRQQNLRIHGVGIVSGLKVSVGQDGIHVSPGLAIDRHGNEIVVDEPQLIPFPPGCAPVSLVVSYTETLTDPVPSPNDEGTQPSRVEEGFKLEYTPGVRGQNQVFVARLVCCNGRWLIERRSVSLLWIGIAVLSGAIFCKLISRSPR